MVILRPSKILIFPRNETIFFADDKKVFCLDLLSSKSNDVVFSFTAILTEHRNMPMEDAIAFVGKSFDTYISILKGKTVPLSIFIKLNILELIVPRR